jgi:hypothetical protein
LSRNTVAGIDAQLLNTNFFPGKIALADLYFQRSFSNTKGDDNAFGTALYFPNEPLYADFYFKQLGRNYFPALGFANRTDIRDYDGRVLYRKRGIGGLRFAEASTTWTVITDLNNHLESRENIVEAGVATPFLDEFHVRAINDFEDVPAVFKLASTVPVPVGRYTWTNVGANFGTSDARPYSVSLDVICCSFYNGHYLNVDLQFDVRLSALFQFIPHYTYTWIDLPTGRLPSTSIHPILSSISRRHAAFHASAVRQYQSEILVLRALPLGIRARKRNLRVFRPGRAHSRHHVHTAYVTGGDPDRAYVPVLTSYRQTDPAACPVARWVPLSRLGHSLPDDS